MRHCCCGRMGVMFSFLFFSVAQLSYIDLFCIFAIITYIGKQELLKRAIDHNCTNSFQRFENSEYSPIDNQNTNIDQ